MFTPKSPHHGLPDILHWYACGVDGWARGQSVYGHVIAKFSWMGSLPHFLAHGALLHALHVRELCCNLFCFVA